MKVAIYINNERVDLFKDEEINIISSVLDMRDLSKNTTEFSQSFTLPATNANNNIFKHYYNADIVGGFDARVAVTARIEVHSDLFRSGKITLQKVNIKKGKAESYVVNFFGELLSLKKIIGSDKLSDLDTSEFNDDYTPEFIKALLTDSQTPYEIANTLAHRSELICSMLVRKRCFYRANTSAFDTETEANLHYEAGNPDKGVLWSDLVPSVNILYLLNRIENKYGVTFSTNFIESAPLSELYLLLDNSNETKAAPVENPYGFDVGALEKLWIKPDGISITVNSGYVYQARITIIPSSYYSDVVYTLRISNNYQNIYEVTGKGSLTYMFTTIDTTDVYMTYSIVATEYISFKPSASVQEYDNGTPSYFEIYTNDTAIDMPVKYEINKHIPDIGILDFLKGLLQAFKLIMIVDNEKNIYIDTLDTFYDSGIVHDITKYIDTNSNEVASGTIFNTVKFKFKESKTILSERFKGEDEEGYGDEVLYVKDDSGELADGSTQEIKLPFEQIVYERLIDANDNSQTNICYGALIDKSLKPVSVNPHIHYAIKEEISTKLIGFKTNPTDIEDLGTDYFRPSHRESEDAEGIPFLFSNEVDEFTYETLQNSLYKEYHENYLSSLFSVNRRSYNFKAKGMPINIINSIGLNDIIIIRNNRYRINNFKSSLVSGDVTFNLYNIHGDE